MLTAHKKKTIINILVIQAIVLSTILYRLEVFNVDNEIDIHKKPKWEKISFN